MSAIRERYTQARRRSLLRPLRARSTWQSAARCSAALPAPPPARPTRAWRQRLGCPLRLGKAAARAWRQARHRPRPAQLPSRLAPAGAAVVRQDPAGQHLLDLGAHGAAFQQLCRGGRAAQRRFCVYFWGGARPDVGRPPRMAGSHAGGRSAIQLRATSLSTPSPRVHVPACRVRRLLLVVSQAAACGVAGSRHATDAPAARTARRCMPSWSPASGQR
jgi:hypothetical protein